MIDGSDIRAAREAAGLTQDQAAALVHVDRVTWARWENGTRAMHPAMWELFCLKTAPQGAPAPDRAATIPTNPRP